jgi:uncharacterized protein (DUF1697 family)
VDQVAAGEGGSVFEGRRRRKRVALVVFLRGVNVGGHRTFRPTTLAGQLRHLDAVNIGAAGTFVVRRPVTRAHLRAELARRLPFDTEIVICPGREIVRLMSQNPFADQPVRPDIVRFVSVLSKRPRSAPSTPISFPSGGKWLLKILARDNRFVFGMYRRHMKVISYLGTFDRLFGVPATTRNWNTITAIASLLGNDRVHSRPKAEWIGSTKSGGWTINRRA